MILCLTPNVAVDRTLMVPEFTPGQVQRVESVIVQAGGKGLNVARAMRTIGGDPLAMGLVGGSTGRQIAEMVANEGLPAVWTWFDGETRISTAVVAREGGVTVLNERGSIQPGDWQRLTADVLANLHGVNAVCISGSLPAGAPRDAPADLITAIRQAGVRVWLDASGAALKSGVAAAPSGLKINADEAGELLGLSIDDQTSAGEAARRLRDRGMETVVITLGARGAVLADAQGVAFVAAPQIKAVSDVGSGDSFLAALVLALTEGADGVTALRRAVAAGGANALQTGAGQFSVDAYQALIAEISRQPAAVLY